MRRVLKKLGFWTLYAFYLLAFFAAVDYVFFYRPYVKDLRMAKGRLGGNRHGQPLRQVRHVKAETMKKLGTVHVGKQKNMFFNASRAKPEGVLRICTLGDSFTYGSEVDEGYSYPTLLEERFKREVGDHVEVLNFGVGGYGFHQTFMMWEDVAAKFDCDFHLLGPRGFQPSRDSNFGFLSNLSPYYLHARYVLNGNDVKLIKVLGDDLGERFDAHYKFIQPWRYLRYSRHAPMFLKALVPRAQELPNPFYYDRRGEAEEANDTYQALFGKMAASGGTFVIGHHRRPIADIANSVGDRVSAGDGVGAGDRVRGIHFNEQATFPYLAPVSHASTWGNDLLARQFFAQLTGTDMPLTVIEHRDHAEAVAGVGRESRRPLSTYSRIEVVLGEQPVGQLTIAAVGAAGALGTDALVAIKGDGESVLDSCFFPLELELQPGMQVALRVGSTEHVLGELAVMRGRLNLGWARVEGFEYQSLKDVKHRTDRGEPQPLDGRKLRYRGLFFHGNSALPIEEIPSRGAITVHVGGQPALSGERGLLDEKPGIWFKPTAGSLRIFRANADGYVDVDELAESGVMELVAEHWEDGVVRVPVVHWRKKTLPMPRGAKPPAKIIQVPADTSLSRPLPSSDDETASTRWRHGHVAPPKLTRERRENGDGYFFSIYTRAGITVHNGTNYPFIDLHCHR